jgi:undecaprenyl-diphosphatase
VGYGVYRLYCRITILARYDMRHLWIPIGILCLTILFAFVKAAL